MPIIVAQSILLASCNNKNCASKKKNDYSYPILNWRSIMSSHKYTTPPHNPNSRKSPNQKEVHRKRKQLQECKEDDCIEKIPNGLLFCDNHTNNIESSDLCKKLFDEEHDP